MTRTRILQCVLVVFVLMMTGCESSSSTNSDSNLLSKANVNSNVNTAASTQSAATVNENHGNDAVRTTSEKSGHQSAKPTENTNKQPGRESNLIQSPNSNVPIQGNEQTQRPSDQSSKGTEQTQKESTQTPTLRLPSSLMDWVILGLIVAGCVVMLVVIGMGLLQLRKQSWQHLETHLAKATSVQMSATRDAQKEILDNFSSLSAAQKDTSTRLHDVHTEIRSLARLVRESAHSRGDGRSSYSSFGSSYAQSEPLPTDEPEFPVSASDYLGKMTRFANVVKPDFQNGILINDPESNGELVLIRDSQALFVVPRHTQFQTDQDFHTYYEKYYDCGRPGAGEVWIIGPAVVEKVSGGWQLLEKGLLEIRS